ncbi:uncharacterized protein LOC117114185 [Anneissia japonica]|uniref:uncharacterized protein LOC117114185 n=1 Tax=Anneissia japonica TaxID=1529436 RepID=UPI001425537F|nr:uncharacterized protein LOC117114185 [Anneissia japonica]
MADIEQIFHSFHVTLAHRDFLRFFWYKNNDRAKNIIEYRMGVHLFGNGPSHAVATFGLRKTAEDNKGVFGPTCRNFVFNDFYVDDGLRSVATSEEAISLLRNTQAMLATAKLRLHKVVSNDIDVVQALSVEDRAKVLQCLDCLDKTQSLYNDLLEFTGTYIVIHSPTR